MLSGMVTDQLQQPLVNTNILAVPMAENQELRFAITNPKGRFQLKLASHQSYTITISYLGYHPKSFQLNTNNQDLQKDFNLKEKPDQLSEITLNYTPPVTIKQDTTTYQVDAFATGNERKLREVLEKLPGVEVDKVGNVTVKGKPISKVMVENKTFFTGDSKLAVNNIPADAVKAIEILENYSEIAMLKNLEDSNEVAMNIKLKEDKKQFAFGDVELGSDLSDRYLANPNVFYYSPKTNINAIVDINNIGIKNFTFKDFLDFEGGFNKLITNTTSYFNLMNNDFTQFLNNQDFKANSNQFGALNLQQGLTKNTDINAYIISSKDKTETQTKTLNEYTNNNNPFTENRSTFNLFNNFFTIGKINLEHKPNNNTDLRFNSFVKFTYNTSKSLINTKNPSQNNTINTLTDSEGLQLKQNLSYNLKLSKQHTATLEANYNITQNKPITDWFTNQEILQELIPLQPDSIYNISQTKKYNTHNASSMIKDYWVLNNFNHLYSSVGFNTAFSHFYSNDAQILSNGAINDFNTAGFGNDFNYNCTNMFIGLEYKFQIGIVTFKPMLYTHFYFWTTAQKNSKTTQQKTVALPQITTKIDFNNSEALNLNYSLQSQFPGINQLAGNFVLGSFNSVLRGNTTLENQLYHSLNVSYYKFSLFKQLNIHLNSSFNKKLEQFKTVTVLEGINQYNSFLMFYEPEHNWRINGQISKKINRIKYQFKTQFNYNDFYQLLNAQSNLNISKSTSATLSAQTFFKALPNFETGYTKDFSFYRSVGLENKFSNDSFFIDLEYVFFKAFTLKADYTLTHFKNYNNNSNNTFEVANASLFYQKKTVLGVSK